MRSDQRAATAQRPVRRREQKYAAQAAAFSGVIHVGRLNIKGDAFAEKQERTDMVLGAVAQYVARNFDGAMTADFPGLGVVLEVRVRPISEATPTSCHADAATGGES